MRSISSRDANQQFSKILAAAEAGREVIITKHGKPVAKLIPFSGKKLSKEREAAIEDLVAMLRDGGDHHYQRMTRDEMHER